MNLFLQLSMQLFLFTTIFGNILCLPLFPKDLGIESSLRGGLFHRVRRQGPIVQPSWILNPEEGLFEDFNVRVTNKNLEETEAIRDYIQGTVDNGTYAVELDEGDFEEDEKPEGEDEYEIIPTEDLSQPEPEVKPTNAPQPKPTLPPGHEPKPAPRANPTNAPQPSVTNKPAKILHRFKIAPKIYSAFAGRPFFTWLKKSLTV